MISPQKGKGLEQTTYELRPRSWAHPLSLLHRDFKQIAFAELETFCTMALPGPTFV
jgi:hypothetical protein